MTGRGEWQEQIMRVLDRVEILRDKHGPPETYEDTIALVEPTFDRMVASSKAVAATPKGSLEREAAAAHQVGISIELNMILMKALRSAPGFYQKNIEAAFRDLLSSERMKQEIVDKTRPSMDRLARAAHQNGLVLGSIIGLVAGTAIGAGAVILGALSRIHYWF